MHLQLDLKMFIARFQEETRIIQTTYQNTKNANLTTLLIHKSHNDQKLESPFFYRFQKDTKTSIIIMYRFVAIQMQTQ